MTAKHTSTCRVCGKPLTDALSVETGVGPVCRIAEKLRTVDGRQMDLFGNERSTYTYEMVGDVICIIDHDKGHTVTNDASEVVQDLVECGHDLSRMRVVYRDTTGVWDELVVANGAFAGFRSVGKRDRADAVARVSVSQGAVL